MNPGLILWSKRRLSWMKTGTPFCFKCGHRLVSVFKRSAWSSWAGWSVFAGTWGCKGEDSSPAWWPSPSTGTTPWWWSKRLAGTKSQISGRGLRKQRYITKHNFIILCSKRKMLDSFICCNCNSTHFLLNMNTFWSWLSCFFKSHLGPKSLTLWGTPQTNWDSSEPDQYVSKLISLADIGHTDI